jgi:hypothetical protein
MSWQERFVEEFSQQLINRGYDVPCGIIAGAARKALPLIEPSFEAVKIFNECSGRDHAEGVAALKKVFSHCAKEKAP